MLIINLTGHDICLKYRKYRCGIMTPVKKDSDRENYHCPHKNKYEKCVSCDGHNYTERRTFHSRGEARVPMDYEDSQLYYKHPLFLLKYGEIVGLPEETHGKLYIVSRIVFNLGKERGRTDLIAPASDHSFAERNKKGHLISVPGFVITDNQINLLNKFLTDS